MSQLPSDIHGAPASAVQVFAADALFVTVGANAGDALALPDEVEPGDLYQLDPRARPLRLALSRPESGAGTGSEAGSEPAAEPKVAPASEIGRAGDSIRLIARYTLMADDGDRVELLALEIAGGLYVLPLSPMAARADYTLLSVSRESDTAQLRALMCLSFGRGTRITLADGQQAAVEDLRPGMRVLTRDHGPQALRLVSHASLRALGAFAPVVIPAGVMGNSGDLIVSQHHRMFLYQRDKLPGLSTSELLVQARHLVDDENVFLREGGFTDWYSLVFDRHEIIYAEGIPAESLMVNDATVSRLPPGVAAEVSRRFPGLAQVQHFGTEAGRNFLESLGAENLFRPGPAAGPARSRRRGS